jgi:hypothetical protein
VLLRGAIHAALGVFPITARIEWTVNPSSVQQQEGLRVSDPLGALGKSALLYQ